MNRDVFQRMLSTSYLREHPQGVVVGLPEELCKPIHIVLLRISDTVARDRDSHEFRKVASQGQITHLPVFLLVNLGMNVLWILL